MKARYLILLLCIPLIFITWYRLFPYTLWAIESNGFFVWTPDHMHWIWSQHAGFSVFLSSFFAQFFRWPAIGALLQTLFAFIVLCSSLIVLNRLKLPKAFLSVALLPVMGLWIKQCQDDTLFFSVQFASFFLIWAISCRIERWYFRILFLVPLYFSLTWNFFFIALPIVIGVEFLLKRQHCLDTKREYKIATVYLIPVLLLGGSYYYIGTEKTYRAKEHDHEVAYLAYSQKWNHLLNLIGIRDHTPEELRYILLGLSHKNMLGDVIFHYPVNSEEFFLFNGDMSKEACFFNELFYAHVGLYNEAIHQAFLEATHTDSGMSFRVLMNLVKFNISSGNRVLARKYMDVLSHATCYGDWVEKERALMSALPSGDAPPADRFFMTNSTLRNLHRITQNGYKNEKLNHYYLCALLIRKNLLAFTAYLNKHLFLIEERIPVHYMEALVLAATQGFRVKGVRIPPSVIQQFNEFQSFIRTKNRRAILAKYQYTYWYNYYFTTFPQDSNISDEKPH